MLVTGPSLDLSGRGAVLVVAVAAICTTAWLAVRGDEHARACEARSAPRYAAVQVAPRTAGERDLVLDLSVDVWSEHVAPNEPVVVVLPLARIANLIALGVPHEIVVEDIAAVAAEERARLASRSQRASASTSDWFAEYRDLDEVNARMNMLAASHPGLASVRQLGTSIEGRPIRVLDVSRGGKLGIALDGGQHAREWISVMVPICIAERLLQHADEPRIHRLLDAVSFHIAPVANPDGYAYSWTNDRYWRKNRHGGYGIDLNRNYSVAWGQAGSSNDRSSPNYRGEQAFSEPETRALASLFDPGAIAAHIDFHSFSQVIVYPWSHKRAPPSASEQFAAMANRMRAALSAAHDVPYQVRPGSELRVGSSGTLGDWTYGERGVLSFLIELRPSAGKGGFVLPPEQIAPTCDESLAAVLELADAVVDSAGAAR